MKLLRRNERGQMLETAFAAIALIVGLAVGTIVLAQFFGGVAGPTTDTGHWENADNHLQGAGWIPNLAYSAGAVTTYNSIWSLGWTGMGLLAVAIIVLAAVVIVGYVRLMGGKTSV